MNYNINDTITAIATPPGQGAIAIIRISGKDSLRIIEKFFSRSTNNLKSNRTYYGKIVDNNNVVDSVILLIMKNPNSYTGEDSVEIHCHGGQIITEKILSLVIQNGARAASPGEFTYRAYLNNKIDLTQAEAIQEIIAAQNDLALTSATDHLEGKLSQEIKYYQSVLVDIAALIEAYVDFPEEDLPEIQKNELSTSLDEVIKKMKLLSDTFNDGKMIFEGISLCIIGCPNVGKSSLLNALLKKDKAIVTPIAGTTRDLIEDTLKLGQLHYRLIDTAGIHPTQDIIEQQGIIRSKNAIKKADLILLVLDAKKGIDENDNELLSLIDDDKSIIIWNKIDLNKPNIQISFSDIIEISAKNNINIDTLKNRIEKKIFKQGVPSKEQVLISKIRHKESLQNAIAYCMQAKNGLQDKLSYEFISQDIKSSLYELKKIIGLDVTEDILSSIFSKFCIGK